MRRKKSAGDEPVSDTSGSGDNGGSPRKVIRTFKLAIDNDEQLSVDIVETEITTKDGQKRTVLNLTICRTYVKSDGGLAQVYSYRDYHVAPLAQLLKRAYDFMISARIVEDIPTF